MNIKSFISKKIFNFIGVCFLSIELNACVITNPQRYEEGFFEYVILNNQVRHYEGLKEECIAITQLSNAGNEQSSIEIPTEINGYPVRYIGTFDFSKKKAIERCRYHPFDCKKDIDIYVFDNVIDIITECDANIFICNENVKGIISGRANYFYSTFAQKEYSYDVTSGEGKFANVTFLDLTNENNRVYRIENIENGEKVPKPNNPEKEWYIFDGWYTEEEYINEWDFNKTPHVDENFELLLYAKWRAE